MSTTTSTRPVTRQKVGLVLAGIYSAAQIPSVLLPSPDPGPPMFILALGTALGVVGLVAVVMAWRGNNAAARIAAGAVIVATLTGLPAFFVDGIPAGIRVLVGVSVLLTVVIVYLMFAPVREHRTAEQGLAS